MVAAEGVAVSSPTPTPCKTACVAKDPDIELRRTLRQMSVDFEVTNTSYTPGEGLDSVPDLIGQIVVRDCVRIPFWQEYFSQDVDERGEPFVAPCQISVLVGAVGLFVVIPRISYSLAWPFRVGLPVPQDSPSLGLIHD